MDDRRVLLDVPADLCAELDGAGFDEVERLRGGSEWVPVAESAAAVIITGMSVAANSATVLVAREAFGDLAETIRRFVRRQPRPAGSRVTVRLETRCQGRRSRLLYELETDDDLDVRQLTAALHGLTTGQD